MRMLRGSLRLHEHLRQQKNPAQLVSNETLKESRHARRLFQSGAYNRKTTKLLVEVKTGILTICLFTDNTPQKCEVFLQNKSG